MDKLKKNLIGLFLLGNLSLYNGSCTSYKANIEDEKVARKEVSQNDWKSLLKEADLEADILFMRDKDIIDGIVKNNIFHYYMGPLIPVNDTIPEEKKIPLQLHGHTLLGSDHGPIILNDYSDENRDFPHRRLTTIHEFLHTFYHSKSEKVYTEREIDARAWHWYKTKYIDEVRESGETKRTVKKDNIIPDYWKDLVKEAELESSILFMKDKDIIDFITEYSIIHTYIPPLLIPGQDTVPDEHKLYTFLNAHLSTKYKTIILNDYIDSERLNSHRTYVVVKELLKIFYSNSVVNNLTEKELDARAWVWYKTKYIDEVREGK